MPSDADSRPLTLEEVSQAIHEMWRSVDLRETERTVLFCADDFTFVVGDRSLDLDRFREVMRARAHARYDTRHVLQNIHVLGRDADTVTVSFVSTVWRLEPGDDFPTNLVGDVVERWRRGPNGNPQIVLRELSLFCDTRPLDARSPTS